VQNGLDRKLFALNLDSGDGSAEAMIVVACVVLLAGVLAARVPSVNNRIRALFSRRLRS
jgi:hypothetical protein